MLVVSSSPDAVDLAVSAIPKASRSEIVGLHGDRLKVRLAAPPVNGAANRELEKLLAKALGVPRSSVEVVRGLSGRRKTVRIRGLDQTEVRKLLKLP